MTNMFTFTTVDGVSIPVDLEAVRQTIGLDVFDAGVLEVVAQHLEAAAGAVRLAQADTIRAALFATSDTASPADTTTDGTAAEVAG